MATPGRQTSPSTALFVATTAASSAALGVVLAASRSDATAGTCAAAARRAGACIPGALVGAKPLVLAGLIGLLLGTLIAIAAVLTWREARAALVELGGGRTARPRAAAAHRPHRRGFAVAHRPRH